MTTTPWHRRCTCGYVYPLVTAVVRRPGVVGWFDLGAA